MQCNADVRQMLTKKDRYEQCVGALALEAKLAQFPNDGVGDYLGLLKSGRAFSQGPQNLLLARPSEISITSKTGRRTFVAEVLAPGLKLFLAAASLHPQPY